MLLKGLLRQIVSLGATSKGRLQLAMSLLQSSSSADDIRRHLPELLSSGNWQVRNAAIKLVAKIRDEDRFDLLIEKLLDRNEAGIVRRNAAELLHKWGRYTPEVEHALCQALSDGYWEVRAEAARSLASLAEPGRAIEQKLVKRLHGLWHVQAWLGRESHGQRLTVDRATRGGGALRTVRERNFEVRAGLAEALGALGTTEEAFAAVKMLATDAQWLVRYQAAIALAHFASRLPDFFDKARAALQEVDHLSSGTLPIFVFSQRIGRLLDDMGGGALDPAVLKKRYIHLKHGWHRLDEMRW